MPAAGAAGRPQPKACSGNVTSYCPYQKLSSCLRLPSQSAWSAAASRPRPPGGASSSITSKIWWRWISSWSRRRPSGCRRVAKPDLAPRLLIRDRDEKFGATFDRVAKGSRRPCAPEHESRWRRFVGSLRREVLDHVLFVGEDARSSFISRFDHARGSQSRRTYPSCSRAVLRG